MFLHLICSAIESLFKDFSVGGGGGATTRSGFTMTYAERKRGGGQNPSYTGGHILEGHIYVKKGPVLKVFYPRSSVSSHKEDGL